jgi:hypothetical protein
MEQLAFLVAVMPTTAFHRICGLLAAAALILSVPATGQGLGRDRIVRVQRVSGDGQGRFWAVGSEGFAAYFDGARFVRTDYPMDSGAPDWAYEYSYSGYPSAHVLHHRGKVLIFTKVGDVYLWGGQEWKRIDVQFDPRDRYKQINRVLTTPDGQLLVQLHPDSLIWTSLSDLLSPLAWSATRLEIAPTFFAYLGYFDGRLLGRGWDASGTVPAIRRHEGPGNWSDLAHVDAPDHNGFQGLLQLHDRTLAVVSLGHVYRTGLNPATAAVGPGTKLPLTEEFASDESVDDLVADGIGCIHGSQHIPGHGPWLFGCEYVVELGTGTHALWQCPTSGERVVGALPIPGGVQLVTARAEVWNLIDGQCLQIHDALLE